jgi:LuxR family maltose regulon positive regulatory protein
MEAVSLIRTKLQRPIVSHNLLPRSQLVQQLENRRQRKLTLISAPAGYGKSTLVNQWLETYPTPTAWLSLDENDRDLDTFLSYFVAAIQTTFPAACSATRALLSAPQLPPLGYLTTTLSNDLS